MCSEWAWLYASGYPLKCIAALFPIGTRNLHSSPEEINNNIIISVTEDTVKSTMNTLKEHKPAAEDEIASTEISVLPMKLLKQSLTHLGQFLVQNKQ